MWIGRRNVGFDVAVFLSFLLGFGVASNALMRRLFNAWPFRGGLAIVAGTAATLMVSVAGHRASRLPWPYYVPSLFLAALVVCSLAARRAHRTVARRTDLEDAPAWRRTLLG
jgi:hypothetical protein